MALAILVYLRYYTLCKETLNLPQRGSLPFNSIYLSLFMGLLAEEGDEQVGGQE